MADTKEKDSFDAKKWSTENGHLAEKAYEKWKDENLTPEKDEPKPEDSSNKPK